MPNTTGIFQHGMFEYEKASRGFVAAGTSETDDIDINICIPLLYFSIAIEHGHL